VAELPEIEGLRVLEELGSGSLSSVYKAVEEPLGRTVALKVLKSTIAPSSPFASQLEREAKVLAELCHPNIGLLHAFVKTDTRMYLVLEYVDGFSLATLLKKVPAVPADSVAAIGATVARGLAHAHERAVVHRDIKPANILVSRRGEVKIFDFGIAQRRADDEPVGLAPLRLEDIAAFGTPAYMSPEQILGESVDARSDIFSLGVVLYQLVCGARPFERGDETDRRPAAHRIRRDPAIPLHRRAPDVTPALERIVMRAIEKLPADRFQTAEAFAEQLEELFEARTDMRGDRLVVRALEHAGLVPAPDPAAARAPGPSKRASVRRAVAGLAVLGGLAVAGGISLQATAPREGRTAGSHPLELVPPAPGYLRVLATPWAEVWVDGQRIDVTPFGRGIPLPPGTHYVTLVHPQAPVEKRTVDIAAAETRTIDVVMAVQDLAPRDDAGAREPSAERDKR
jgi:serine/threonine-protein kinase